MTENENVRITDESLDNAISVYKTTIKAVEQSKDSDYCPILDKVTVALLEELKQYRAIGTVEDWQKLIEKEATERRKLEEYFMFGSVEEFKALKEKNVAKKVIRWADGSEHCPCCDFDNSAIGYGVCIDCGQKLDWSE